MTEPAAFKSDNALFTLNIDDRIYRCRVSDAALYMLCRDQDNSMNQLDAYLKLKGKVQAKVEQLLVRGKHALPEVLEPAHFS
jgi:hypothetical protein